MANIWADSFSEIRELSLQEKKGDGNLANNYPPYDKITRGDVIAGATGKDQMGGKSPKKKSRKEVEEEMKPLPKEKMDRQAQRAQGMENRAAAAGDEEETNRQMQRRLAMQMPSSRRTALQNKNRKEEFEQLDEISTKLAGKVVNARIERTGAAADRENKARTPQNVRDTVAAADKEAKARKLASGVRARRAAELNKEERELSSKNNKNDKLDVRKDIHNKINTKPTVSEELEAWVEELISEGYNLSEFTWDEVSEIYESVDLNEADTYGMPAKGDSQNQEIDPMAAAKAKSAKAKVAKERADLQVAQQSQRLKVSATESVLEYVLGRNRLFEGVFDPKKSRLKPASERTKNAMTDAQRKADKKENERIANIHSKGATVLAGLTSSGKRGKVQTTPTPKPAAPEANRTVKGREDKLASAADKVLKSLKNK